MPSYSGLFNGVHGNNYSTLTNKKGNAETMVARTLARDIYNRAGLRETIRSLVGVVPGAAISTSHKRAKAVQDLGSLRNGGLRVIETFTPISRVSTAADVTYINAFLAQTNQPTTYVADKSGNGGGGKAGK